jgi:hypothetical protein
LADLARHYGALSVLGVEIIAVAPRASPDAIAALGASPPVLFPVLTNGNESIVAAYRLFTPSAAHAELLIDRAEQATVSIVANRSTRPFPARCKNLG